MSDLRHDPINNQWIAIAGNRRDRPMEFIPIEKSHQQLICPFCKGNEDETPPALAAFRSDGSPLTDGDDPSSWLVRVVNNKYPSFSVNGSVVSESTPNCGPFLVNRSAGIQELVVPSPRHVTSLSQLTEQELLLSFRVYQERIAKLQAHQNIKHAMLFLNCRSAAGASLAHLHTQLIGSPVIGGLLEGRIFRNEAHASTHGCALIETLIAWEIQQEKRILQLTDNFCVVCPFASRFPFQIWIVPRTHFQDFTTCPSKQRDELARLCRDWILRYESVMEDPSYNMLLHAEPFSVKQNRHWYFELFPRLTSAAGLEWGTDIWVNPISPEAAARRLRVAE